MRVEAFGDSIKTWINGVPAADLVDPVGMEGFIALQVHQNKSAMPVQVRFRNLRIQEFPKSEWVAAPDSVKGDFTMRFQFRGKESGILFFGGVVLSPRGDI